MCGRYTITSPSEAVQRHFQVQERPNLPPRYNLAPTQEAPVVRLADDGARHLVFLRWGLVPFWADDPGIGSRMINARSENAAEKPAFRAAFRRRRCLVVADGFYEWKPPVEKGARKQPYRITREDGSLFAFAGLWERWKPKEGDGQALETFTILTTDANARLADIHPRMPVILPPEVYDHWLDPEAEPSALQKFLGPFPAERVRAYRVSTRVNAVANDDAGLVEPLDGQSGQGERPPEQPRLL